MIEQFRSEASNDGSAVEACLVGGLVGASEPIIEEVLTLLKLNGISVQGADIFSGKLEHIVLALENGKVYSIPNEGIETIAQRVPRMTFEELRTAPFVII